MTNHDLRRSRLLWRSRRGVRELDGLLMPFVKSRYDFLNSKELSVLEKFLEISDPLLIDWFMEKSVPPTEEYKALVLSILAFRSASM